MVNRCAFTLIELLVVIAVIALLLAIFIPVLGTARERGQRAVCLSNLRQLTMAWVAYADDHDGKLVEGTPSRSYASYAGVRYTLDGWVGDAFFFPESRSALIEDPDKGALWRYVRDVGVYRCPRGRAGHAVTYAIVAGANGISVEGTHTGREIESELLPPGLRVGDTVLKLIRLTDIVSPGAGQRAVFIDVGDTPAGNDFYVHYLYPKWRSASPPPIHHADGVTLSMADGHVEYWKWKGAETVKMPRELVRIGGLYIEMLIGPDYEPRTEDGLYDLQTLQRATWGRLGYPAQGSP